MDPRQHISRHAALPLLLTCLLALSGCSGGDGAPAASGQAPPSPSSPPPSPAELGTAPVAAELRPAQDVAVQAAEALVKGSREDLLKATADAKAADELLKGNPEPAGDDARIGCQPSGKETACGVTLTDGRLLILVMAKGEGGRYRVKASTVVG